MNSPLSAALLKHRNTIDQPVIVVIGSPLDPKIEQHDFVEKGGTVAQHLEKYDLVTVPRLVLYNSEPLLEVDWDSTTLESGDVLTLMSEPGDPITIALLVMAAVSLLVTAYSLYTLLTQDVPNPGERGDSPNYSLVYARGNQTRPGQPMPCLYGEYRCYPDLAGQFSLFDDNEQVLYQLFDVTVGEVEPITAADIYFEETPLTSFDSVEIEHLEPGEKSTLFPAGAIEVDIGEIELTGLNESSQVFVVNDESTPLAYISFTMSAPNGVYSVDDKGRFDHWPAANYVVEYREKDGPGGWTSHAGQLPSNYGTPTNLTGTYAVTPGIVYEARVTRTVQPRSYKTNDSNQLFWTKLIGISAGDNEKETTRIALKIRASSTLGNASLNKMNVVVKRKIPVWTGSSWTAPQHTKLAVWAFADMARAQYGGRTRDSLIDLDKLLELAAEGAEYNGVHDNKITLWQALNSAARPMFARAVQLPGGVYSVVQDLEDQSPVMLFNSRNTIANSYGVEFNVPTQDDVNFVRVSFFNAAEGFRETSVDCVPYGVQKNEPYEVTIRGVTSAAAAYEIGIRMANESKYRRKRVMWSATLDAMIPRYGDVVRVGNYTTGLEQNVRALNGEVKSHNGTVLTVYEDLTELVGKPGLECVLMNITGTPFYAGACTVPGPQTIDIVGTIPQSLLVYGDDFQGPKFCVGEGSAFLESVKITKISQQQEHTFKIEGVVDDPGAYAGDEPPDYTQLPPTVDRSPKITNLQATLYGTDDNVKVRLTWVGDFSDYYIVDYARAGFPNDWVLMGKPTAPNFNAMVPQEDGLTIRVRGVSMLIGKPSLVYVDILSRTITYPGVFNLRPKAPFSASLVHVEWDALPRGKFAVLKFIFLGEVVRQQRVDETTTDAFITVEEVAARFGQSIQGGLYPAVGCRNATVRLHGLALVQGVWQESEQYTEIEMRNEPMVGLRQLEYRELFTSISISFSWPDPAPGGVFIHMSQQAGFNPDESNLRFFGNSNSITLTDAFEPGERWYITCAGMDVWGPDDLVYSPQYLLITTQADSDFVMPPIDSSLLHPALSARIDEIDGGQQAGFQEGLLRQWTVKIDPGGAENYVAGFGLAYDVPEQGQATSEFLVLAHRFGIAEPGNSTFTFLSEKGQVRMDGARIRDASIQTASIRDAAVDTLTIAGAAVTAQYSDEGPPGLAGGSFLPACSVTMNVVAGTVRVDWLVKPYLGTPPGADSDFDRQMRLMVDAVELPSPYQRQACDRWWDSLSRWGVQFGYSGTILVDGLSVGEHNFTLEFAAPGGAFDMDGSLMFVTEAKR